MSGGERGYQHTSEAVISLQNPKRQRVCSMTLENTVAFYGVKSRFRVVWTCQRHFGVLFIEYIHLAYLPIGLFTTLNSYTVMLIILYILSSRHAKVIFSIYKYKKNHFIATYTGLGRRIIFA